MVDFARYRFIRHERRGRILTLTLDRPGQTQRRRRRAACGAPTIFSDAADDPGSDVIVLTGAGRAFCSGGDIPWMQTMIDEGFGQTAREAKRINFSPARLRKPIIARVNGHATGFGATLALFCDVVFAAETAKIGDLTSASDLRPVMAPRSSGRSSSAMRGPRNADDRRSDDRCADAARMGLINHAVPARQSLTRGSTRSRTS